MSYRKSTDFLLSIPSNRSFESTRQNRNFSISSLNMKPVTFVERCIGRFDRRGRKVDPSLTRNNNLSRLDPRMDRKEREREKGIMIHA